MSVKKPPDLLTYATMIELCLQKHKLQIKWRNGSQHIKWLLGTILLLHIKLDLLTAYAVCRRKEIGGNTTSSPQFGHFARDGPWDPR